MVAFTTVKIPKVYGMEVRFTADCTSEEKVRGLSLIRALHGPFQTQSTDLTPARCEKWRTLFMAGFGADERGFYLKAAGHRYRLPDALKIAEDLA